MHIEKAIDKWILVRVIKLPDELIGQITGIYDPNSWLKAKLVGVDALGIWLENPYFKITDLVDREGNPIPPEQRREVTKTAKVLVKWDYIASILRVEGDETDQDTHSVRLGFRPPTKA